MNSKIIIITILILVKVVGVASYSRADETFAQYAWICGYNSWSSECGYNPEALNIWGQKSINKFAEDSYFNKRINDFIKCKEIF